MPKNTLSVSRRPLDLPWRYFGRWLLVCIVIITAFSPSSLNLPVLLNFSPVSTARAASTTVIISQVYGGGGNSGAPYQNDFIELFNRGNTAVSLNGWSVQYGSSDGSSIASNFGASGKITNLPNITLQPGQYLLVQEASQAAVGAVLPAPDATGNIAMAAGSAKVALVNSTTALNCGAGATICNSSQLATIVDLVGYGSVSGSLIAEGTHAPALSNTTAGLRGNHGCTDTDNNSTDFTAGAPNPRNSVSLAVSCSGNSPIIPNCGGTLNVIQGIGANRQITAGDFDGVVSSASITNLTPSPSPGAITLGSITPASGPGGSLSATLSVNNTVVTGTYNLAITFSNNDSPLPQTATCNLIINVNASGYTPIAQIQGAAGIAGQWKSPYEGNTETTEGIVTTMASTGFWMQDPNPDNDLNTSEGIFVYTGNPVPGVVAVGKRLRVTGQVQEYKQSIPVNCADATKSTITELSATNAANIADTGITGTIAPTILSISNTGPNIRTIPTQLIYSTPGMNQDVDGIDFWESLEGMLVEVDDALVIGPSNSFREAFVLADNGAGATTLDARDGLYITPTDSNPERIHIVMPAGSPKLVVGDIFNVALVGNVDIECFSTPSLNVSTPLSASSVITSGRVQREVLAPLNNPNYLRVSNFNVENLSPSDNQNKFNLLASQIITNMAAPDIITLEEVQDNSGETDDGITDATQTLEKLRSSVFTASNFTINYAYTTIDPQNDTGGGAPGGNIRIAIFYRTDRGLTFNLRPAPSPQYSQTNSIRPDGSLLYNPGLIDPNNSAFQSSRKPLAAEFGFNGQRLIVIGNHWNSKLGDDSLYGLNQPPVLGSETQRNQQATVVRNFVNQLQAANPNAFVVLNGDFNDFEFSNPISNVLKVGPTAPGNLLDGIETIPLAADRYTYRFEGNAQSIDHAFYSQNLSNRLIEANAVHINSDFYQNTATFSDPLAQVSDHDPVAVVFDLTAPDIAVSKSHTGSFAAGNPATYSLVVSNTGGSIGNSVLLTDTLPAGMYYVSASGTNWSCTAGSPVSCIYTGSLASGASTTLNLTVNSVQGLAGTTVTNTVAVSTQGDITPGNNTATDPTFITAGVSCAEPFNVTSSTDNGQGGCGTLSYALSSASVATQTVTITFTATTVNITGPLPLITNSNGLTVTLSGTCSPDANGYGVPGVKLTGSGVSTGLTLSSSIVITGVALAGFTGNTVSLTGSNNQISCSWLGTANGTGSDTAAGSTGLLVAAGAKNNRLGQPGSKLDGNLIVGKGSPALKILAGGQVKLYPGNRIRQI